MVYIQSTIGVWKKKQLYRGVRDGFTQEFLPDVSAARGERSEGE